MPLYTSFKSSDYYDDEPVVKKVVKPVEKTVPSEYKKPHKTPNNSLTPEKRKSLYAQAKAEAESPKYTGPNFKELYRIGQMIQIVGPNGEFRTKKGRICEIVDKNLMYVYMEDSHKDAQDQWLVDFVTDKDKIIKI